MKLHRLKAYFYLVLVAVIWGIASPVIKHTLQGISSLPFLTYRFALSSAVAIPTFLLAGIHIPKLKETLPYVLLYGFLVSTVALGLLFLGLEKTTVLDMTLITAVGPLLIALAGVVFLKEHITSREKVGMALAFSGTIVKERLHQHDKRARESKSHTYLFS
ncbi:MAG: DMT family transporter [Patescibacteria group bacterium]